MSQKDWELEMLKTIPIGIHMTIKLQMTVLS